MDQSVGTIADVPSTALEEHDLSEFDWLSLLASARRAMESGVEVHVDPLKVRRMPDQPRKYFNPESIVRLSVSMKSLTQLVPGIIRAIPGGVDENGAEYEILDGERRWRSATLAEMDYRAILVEVDNASVPFIIAAVANFNREGHTATEISDSISHMRKLNIPMEEVAKILGISVNWATQMLMLQRLHPDVRDLLDPTLGKKKMLPTTAAIQISKTDPSLQMGLARMVLDKKVSLVEIRRQAIKQSQAAGTSIRTHLEPRRAWRSVENQSEQAVRSILETERLLDDEGSDALIRGRSVEEIARLTTRLKTLRSASLRVLQRVNDTRM